MANFQVVIRSGPTPGKAWPLDRGEMFIGRELGNDIVINDPEMSRRHARIFLQGANYVIEDLGSTNGTSVNGQRLMGPYLLRPGETIQFGEKVRIQFEQMQAQPDATMVAAPTPPVMQPPPAYPPPPVYTPPAQAYVPPMADFEEPPQKKKFPIWIVIVLVLLLLCCCVIGISLYYLDSQNMWCGALGPLFNSVSPGTCP
jgi:predicted component of type VI protein secretion system